MPAELVRATALTRRFGERVAVKDVSLSLAAGEIVALLGPNGAGKTTTLRMMAGLITASSGEIAIHGTPLNAASTDRLRHHIGLLTETPGLWDRLSVGLNLATYARLHGLSSPARVVGQMLDRLGLADRSADPAGTLSKGLRQRVAIARALLHDPSILLLDEPTAGLDPANARLIRDLVKDLVREGRAVLVCTHNLAEAEDLADRVAVIRTSLLALDTPAALRRRLSGVRLEIEVEGRAELFATALSPRVVEDVAVSGSTLAVTLADAAGTPDVVAALVAAGARVRRVMPEQRTLEEVYLTIVSEESNA